jgi:hypothetical protein
MSGEPSATTALGERHAGDGDAGPLAPPVAAKARRVAGVFLVMLGLSVLIDGHVLWLGGPITLAGCALFAWGLFEQKLPGPVRTDEAADPVS